MDVESVDGVDDVGAELGDVHVAEVNVLTAPAAALCRPMALMFVPCVQVSLRGSGRRWRSVRLTWTATSRKHQLMF